VANVLSQETSGVSVRVVTGPRDFKYSINPPTDHRFAMICSALDDRIESI
jgi:hypothetical protein